MYNVSCLAPAPRSVVLVWVGEFCSEHQAPVSNSSFKTGHELAQVSACIDERAMVTSVQLHAKSALSSGQKQEIIGSDALDALMSSSACANGIE